MSLSLSEGAAGEPSSGPCQVQWHYPRPVLIYNSGACSLSVIAFLFLMETDGPVKVLEMFFFSRFSFSLVIIMWAGKLKVHFRAKVLSSHGSFHKTLLLYTLCLCQMSRQMRTWTKFSAVRGCLAVYEGYRESHQVIDKPLRTWEKRAQHRGEAAGLNRLRLSLSFSLGSVQSSCLFCGRAGLSGLSVEGAWSAFADWFSQLRAGLC